MVKLSKFDNFPNLSQWINNVFQRYERSGQAAKTSIKATYFAFIKEKYVLFNELINIDDIKIPETIINTINKLNSLSHEEVSKIYSKESLYSTIIENSTLTDYNLEKWILMILK